MDTATLHLNNNESHLADAIWTLIDSAGVRVKTFIRTRLNQQFKEEEQTQTAVFNSHDDFLKYLDTIPMKGGDQVPLDEDGKMALVDKKYNW